MTDDFDLLALEPGQRQRHLIQDARACRPQHRAARLELDDAVAQGLVHQALLLGRHPQTIAHRVGRVERGRHVAGHLLAHRLVGHLALQIDDVALHAQLPPADLLQRGRQHLLQVLRPLRRRHHRAQRQLVDHPVGAVQLAQPRQDLHARGLVGDGAGHHHLMGAQHLSAIRCRDGLRTAC